MNVKMFSNKKGINPIYFLIVAVFLGLAAFAMYSQGPTYKTSYIGEPSIKLIDISYELQSKVLYIKESAKIASEDSIQELFDSTSKPLNQDCGKHGDYYIWATNDKECYPGINQEFLQLFEDKFKTLLQNNQIDPKLRYSLLINKDKMILNPSKNIEILSKDKKIMNSIEPVIETDLPYDLSINDQAVEMAKNVLISCKEAEDKEKCINEIPNIKDHSGFKDGFALFDADTGYRFYKSGKWENLIIKFCISFS